ncbi:hypothetical protein AAVH_41531 [Aphelenchoides avenae]|nr:hypothetical protein AAVH_41531 [Aphelenchus avenae]
MHKAVEQESLEIVIDLFQQPGTCSTKKRQTVLLSDALDEALESAALALLKPDYAELYQDFDGAHDGPGTSRRCP